MESIFIKLSNIFESYPYLKTFLFSVLLVLFLLILRKMIYFNIDKKKIPKSEKVFLKKKSAQYLNYLTLLTLFLFWFSQLQVLFVSLFAIAAAVVIAFKELIMCFTGGFLIRSAKSFSSGQRIEVGGLRGFVIDTGLFVTKVLEIGPEKNSQQTTGDIITLPNSVVLSTPVKNGCYFKDYSIKTFQFKVEVDELVDEFEAKLLVRANELCQDYVEAAKKSISKFCEKEGFDIPSINPRTKIILDEDHGAFIVLIKVPVQNSKIADLEQVLNRFYLKWRIEHKEKFKKKTD